MKEKLHELIETYKKRCDYLEIRLEEISNISFSFSNREVSSINEMEDWGGGIRACYKGGWGFTSFNSPEKIDKMVNLAVEQAKEVVRGITELAPVPPVQDHSKYDILADPREVPLKDKIELFKSYNDLAYSHSPLIQNVKIRYFDKFKTVTFINSEGSYVVHEKLDLGFSCLIFAKKGDVTQYTLAHGGSSNDYRKVLGKEEEIKESCERAVKLVHAAPVKGGKYPVVVDHTLGGVFAHEAFGHLSEADSSMDNPQMKDVFKLGKVVGSPFLSIYDTGSDVGSRGYVIYDDEGVRTKKVYLIKHGVLSGRLHSRESAAKFGEEPTGNARAISYKFPPICRMRNTCVDNGDASFDELLDGIKTGVYACGVRGGTADEMFSFNAEYGYMIRDGKIAELVRDIAISGNVFTTLKMIDKIGNDFKISEDGGGCGKGEQYPLEIAFSAPHFRIKEATVGGK